MASRVCMWRSLDAPRFLRDLVHARLRTFKQLEQLETSSALGRQIVDEVPMFVSAEAARVRLKVLDLAVDKRSERSVFE